MKFRTVVGGGIGGTSASYFLRELFGPHGAFIDLYEANKIGGRLSVVEVDGRDYEMGGSVIHPQNKYMVDFLKLLGLKKRQTRYSRCGLYNGHEFVFTESDWEIITLAKLAWRYGYSIIKLQNYIGDMLKKFERIYTLQANGKSFSSVSDLLKAMSPQFVDDMHVSTKDGFRENGFSERIVDELVLATLRANYGQSATVHKFVGSVSVAGADGGLWAVHGGNIIVPQMLLERSQATLINARVTNITLRPETEDFLVNSVQGKGFTSSLYDMIIIATPLTENTQASIRFLNFPKSFTFPGVYHKTVSTIVHGKLNVTYFGFENEKEAVDEILTVKQDLVFNSVGRLNPVDYTPNEGVFDVWKVFSQRPLTKVELNDLFLQQKDVHVVDWLAYPHYHSEQRTDEFILHKHLFYINAIEWAASAMEMSVVGAKNVALLSYKTWTGISEAKETGNRKEEL
ncbi:prenylcysteine oxidase 1 isoform X2 [Cryptotermes secundus]|uniref:prenylcysteine oxidase 1 isoform X2 n=1 Tax=Cryptotermes secundus TaxID=105785 RepID=UPI000CD7BA9F|nr:prenylcysteine oxidase 1 isoform X2 [Cryptotermes secundus]